MKLNMCYVHIFVLSGVQAYVCDAIEMDMRWDPRGPFQRVLHCLGPQGVQRSIMARQVQHTSLHDPKIHESVLGQKDIGYGQEH